MNKFVALFKRYCQQNESDEYDAIAKHFLLFPSEDTSNLNNAIGTCRTIVKIGRVVVAKEGRMKGAGTALMTAAEQEARRQGTFRVAKLLSQCVAQRFYASCGFVPEGEVVLEGGAPHIMMVKSLE
ncbi:acyl-CoA N-acyltransferase [Rhizoclosmatium globosum]|uniref:Acyl-CoA N-acyltransferase n=1 Tax=Rhizoclosmatium globosum TaxID=329046 RepID=A0A1Y2D1S7_9FUNG|nr:acyl-CoA N-acyltransferase [Rhizoclosmatium globosum]|eukprot:ORY53243.1 acyl-CoA N-acyltransferase [Rhizoclosmatium globosum]